MRNFAIVGIVVVLLTVIAGAGLALRASQDGTAANSATSGGGGPALFPFLGRAGGGNRTTNTSSASQITAVNQGDVVLTVSATGNVVANQQSNLSFQQSGTVKTVTVQTGDRVKAGQVLATLSDIDQQASLSKAQNSLKAAQAALDKLLQPVSAEDIASAEAHVKSAMASYQSAASSGTSAEGIKAYELQYQQALSAINDANYALAGAGGQYSSDSPGYQKALAAVGLAQVNADQAKLKLDQAKNSGSSLEQVTANIALAQVKLAQVKAGPSQSEIDSAQALVEIANVQLEQAKHALTLAQLTAPFDGVVTEVDVKAGEVTSGTAFVLVDTSTLYVDVNVDEADIGQIAPGTLVSMTIDALPDAKLTGKVLRITPLANTSSTSVITYVVRVALDKTDAPIKVGMTVSADFTVASVQNVLRVPNSYLKTNKTYNQTTVNLITQTGGTTLVPVTVGLEGNDYSEVINGLRPGDRISVNAIAAQGGSNLTQRPTTQPANQPAAQGNTQPQSQAAGE